MSTPRRREDKHRKVALVLYPLAAALAALGAFDTHADATALRDRGVQTDAVVVDTSSESARHAWVDVEFTTPDGQRVVADAGDMFDPWPARGDVVEVIYDTQRPDVVVSAWGGPDFMLPVVIGAGAVFCLVGAVCAATRTGRPLWAPRT